MSEGNGKLPEGWSLASVDDFAGTATGGTPSRKRPDYYGGAIPWVKSGDLKDGFVTQVDEFITEKGLAESNAKVFPKGCVCIALYGATVGKLGILDLDAATNQAVCGIFPEGSIEAKYIFHALRNEKDYLISKAQGGAQPNISNGIIKKTKLRLAPLAEQRRIVAKIEALQERSRKAREALAEVGPLLEQFRQSLLAAAFRGDLTADWRAENPDVEPASVLLARIRQERRRKWEEAELAKYEAQGKTPPKSWQAKYQEPELVDDTELPELPEGWCWSFVEEACSHIVDCPHSTPKWTSDGKLCVRTTEFRPGKLDLSTAKFVSKATFEDRISRLRPEPGDVIYSREGGILGIACQIPPETELCLGQRMMLMRTDCFIEAAILMHWLNSPMLLERVKRLTSGSASPHLNVGDVKKFPIPIPPVREQICILNLIRVAFDSLENSITCLSDSQTQLTQLDQSILTKAFRGELVPQDPNDEPASVLLERIRQERESAAQNGKPRRGTKKKEGTGIRKPPQSRKL